MIRAVVVDDEKPSTDVLKRLLEENGVEVAACFDKARDALGYMDTHGTDVAFLDIEMPGMSGLEMANHICETPGAGCEVVFVTAFNQYAVDAFRVHALDYLLKPVSKARLIETLDRIKKRKAAAPSAGQIRIQCFGGFQISTGGIEVKFRTKKAEELLAFLIDKRGAGASRSEIIDRLWGDFDGDRAIVNFNTTLYYTRKALDYSGVDLPILYENNVYKIDTRKTSADFMCDFYSFAQCPLPDSSILQEHIGFYEGIAALYLGEYLAANEYNWAEKTRLDLREKYIRIVLALSDSHRSAGKPFKSLELLKQGFGFEPLNSRITHDLIELMLSEGNYSLAAGYYNTHRAAYIKMFGREPDNVLMQLLK